MLIAVSAAMDFGSVDVADLATGRSRAHHAALRFDLTDDLAFPLRKLHHAGRVVLLAACVVASARAGDEALDAREALDADAVTRTPSHAGRWAAVATVTTSDGWAFVEAELACVSTSSAR